MISYTSQNVHFFSDVHSEVKMFIVWTRYDILSGVYHELTIFFCWWPILETETCKKVTYQRLIYQHRPTKSFIVIMRNLIIAALGRSVNEPGQVGLWLELELKHTNLYRLFYQVEKSSLRSGDSIYHNELICWFCFIFWTFLDTYIYNRQKY